MEDVMKNVKPTIVGRIRKEAFGGIYYERDRLVIELLNDSAYEILSLCQQGKTQEEIEQYLLSEYEADPHLIKDDLQEYLRAFYKDVVQWFDEKYGETDMVLCTPNMLNIGDEGRYAKVFDSSGIMPACGAGKIHCTVDPYGDVKLCPSDEHVLKEEKNNLLEKDMKQIWKDSSVLNWIRGAEFIKCQRCGERCEFSCPLARKERKEEFICSFKQVMH